MSRYLIHASAWKWFCQMENIFTHLELVSGALQWIRRTIYTFPNSQSVQMKMWLPNWFKFRQIHSEIFDAIENSYGTIATIVGVFLRLKDTLPLVMVDCFHYDTLSSFLQVNLPHNKTVPSTNYSWESEGLFRIIAVKRSSQLWDIGFTLHSTL